MLRTGRLLAEGDVHFRIRIHTGNPQHELIFTAVQPQPFYMHIFRRPIVTVVPFRHKSSVDEQLERTGMSDLYAHLHILRHNQDTGKVYGAWTAEPEHIFQVKAILTYVYQCLFIIGTGMLFF